tara:strand:- start:110 stop:1366 length:1257 start_codon:yes stop_codon:yes gene_type:complete
MAKADNIFEDYFDLVEPSSESPFIYHRWSMISGIGALLGRQASLKFGFDTLYANQFICLMGGAGSRKSSAISIMRKILSEAGYTTFSREKTSKENFLVDLSKGFDNISNPSDSDLEKTLDTSSDDPSEVLISAGELEDFLGSNDTGFISLLTNLWDNLDQYNHGKTTAKSVHVHKPTVSMIGGCTPTTFATVFPPEVIGQGMLSRLLLIFGGGARTKITKPPDPDPDLWTGIVEQIKATKELVKGKFTVSDGAMKIWDEVYQYNLSNTDRRLESYWSRRHNHYYKLCMIIAASDQRLKITEEDAYYANSILHYAEHLMPKALGEFGRSENSYQTEQVVNYLQRSGGSTLMAMFKELHTDFKDIKELGTVVQKLKSADKLIVDTRTHKLSVNVSSEIPKLPHVDFSMLRENNYKQEIVT